MTEWMTRDVSKKGSKKLKGCDFGYGLAASSCEGANGVDACTVTASDAITAFAVPHPNQFLAEPVGFFGSGYRTNRFARRITRSTSDWQLLIEANPFNH